MRLRNYFPFCSGCPPPLMSLMLSSPILDTATPVPLPMLTPAELKKALLVSATQGIFTGKKTGEKDPISQTPCSLPVIGTDTPFGKQLI